jgi:hypothetical protein
MYGRRSCEVGSYDPLSHGTAARRGGREGSDLASVCVCVREKVRERERVGVCVTERVCVRERERERERV